MRPEDTHYIGEVITVEFDRPPLYSKRPHCPDRFIWRGKTFAIVEVLSQRVDFGRRGRMSMNMQPEHAARAAQQGSWGVGRYFFTVRAEGGRAFELYYDRAPKDIDHPEGVWFLRYEIRDTKDE
jgi:hypothetical protein